MSANDHARVILRAVPRADRPPRSFIGTQEGLRELTRVCTEQLEISRAAIARLAGMSSARLTTLLDKGNQRVPKEEEIRRLVEALAVLIDDSLNRIGTTIQHGEVRQLLAELAESADVSLVRSPPGGVISYEARNYLRRPCDAFVEAFVHLRGYYLIDGPPQSGRTSLARRLEAIAGQAGVPVAYVDWRRETRQVGLRQWRDLSAAFAAALPGLSVSDSHRPIDILELWLTTSDVPRRLLIIEDANSGSESDMELIGQLLRTIANRAFSATSESAWSSLSVWSVMGSYPVQESVASLVSAPPLRLSDVTDVTWLTYNDVLTLTRLYPVPAARLRTQWEEEVANAAFRHFSGQPLLTQTFIAECAGGVSRPDELPDSNRSAYNRHLNRISEMVFLHGESSDAVAQGTAEGPLRCTWLLDQLHVANFETGAWTCKFYGDCLIPFYVKRRPRLSEKWLPTDVRARQESAEPQDATGPVHHSKQRSGSQLSVEHLVEALRRVGIGAGRSLVERRRFGRSGISISDEYDLQDVIEAVLRSLFDDVRPEEPTGSSGPTSSRMDFFLPEIGVGVEIKVTSPTRGAADIKDQLLRDINDYRQHLGIGALVFVVYDMAGNFKNPAGFERDFSRSYDGLDVRVLVVAWSGPRAPSKDRRSGARELVEAPEAVTLLPRWDTLAVLRTLQSAPTETTVSILQTWIPDEEVLFPGLFDLVTHPDPEKRKRFRFRFLLVDPGEDLLLNARTLLRGDIDLKGARERVVRSLRAVDAFGRAVAERVAASEAPHVETRVYKFLPFGPLYMLSFADPARDRLWGRLYAGVYLNYTGGFAGPMLEVTYSPGSLYWIRFETAFDVGWRASSNPLIDGT